MFLTNTKGTSAIPLFIMVFSGKLFYGIVLVILDHYKARKHQLEASFTAKSPVDLFR